MEKSATFLMTYKIVKKVKNPKKYANIFLQVTASLEISAKIYMMKTLNNKQS